MSELRYREAGSADVPAMEASRANDPDAGRADERMAAYLDGMHHPHQALPERTAFIALDGEDVAGYIAGHATTRFGCDGEVQYLYVGRSWRRGGVASTLLRLLAEWFNARGIRRVCVNANLESPAAVPFYTAVGALPLNAHWYVWPDINGVELSLPSTFLRPGAACRQSRLPGWLRLAITFGVLFALKYALPVLGISSALQVVVLLLVATGFAWLFWWNCSPDRRGVAILIGLLWIAGLVKLLRL